VRKWVARDGRLDQSRPINGHTPLHDAPTAAMVSLILDLKPDLDVNSQTVLHRNTPAHKAAGRGDAEAMHVLLGAATANPDIVNWDDMTAEDVYADMVVQMALVHGYPVG
jgi:ankyrin repeat protein